MIDAKNPVADQQLGEAPPEEKGIRWLPTLALGCVLTALNAIWIAYLGEIRNQGWPALVSIYYNVVFTLVIVFAANSLVRRGWPRAALSRAEMLVLFVMMTVGISISAMTQTLMGTLAYPHHAKATDPGLERTLIPYLPRSLTVSDPDAVKSYYLGRADLWTWAAIRPWLSPLIGWGVFIVAMVWTGIAMSAMVYNHWRYQERLPFPMIQIPLMVTEEKKAFYKSPLFWLGFSIAAGIDILNTLSTLYPNVPGLAVKRSGIGFPGLASPWSALSPTLYSWNPFLIGLEFFLPVDLLFSVFFFYWAGRLQGVLVTALGLDIPVDPASMVAPYVREQAFGSIVALAIFALWTARGLWRDSWRKHPLIMPINSATLGLAAGSAIMIGVLFVAGMPAVMAVLFVGIYLVVVFSITHIRAQYGPPCAGLFLTGPGPILYDFVGRSGLGMQGLASMVPSHWIAREYAFNPTAATLEGYALAGRQAKPGSRAVFVLAAAIVGYLAAFGTTLAIGYKYGYSTAHTANVQTYLGNEPCAFFARDLSDSTPGIHGTNVLAMAMGVAVTLALQALRTRFVAFPLHPVGYAMASTYTSTFVWSTAMVTWLFKSLLLRYTGLKGYRTAAPFFLGLLLGEFIVGSLISLAAVFTDVSLYVFWPY